MAFTTRTKITILFSSIVVLLVSVLNIFIFQSANSVWQNKKAEYMHQAMKEVLSIDDAKKMIADLQVESSTGLILHRQGIFTHAMEHRSIGSFFFQDPYVTIANGRAYYWGIETKGDGYTYKTVDDVTDIIFTRDMLIERSIWVSLFGMGMIALIGYIFSGYILRPIQNMNEAARKFSLSEKAHGQSVGIYGNIKDEVVILARSLEELFLRVNKEAQRLEQFSDDIAHEIKNRLFEILSTLDLALTAPHPKEGIEKAKTIVKQLSGVVDALLFFARNEMPSPGEYNLSDLLKNELNFDDPRIQYLGETGVRCTVHKELFLTAIGNIVGNALKFTKKDGYVHIILSEDMIEIVDNGIGISKKDLPHIFDRLYMADRARTSGGGHGLGLSISKKILEELHGMKLSVKSIPDQGTIFTIELHHS